MWASKWNLSNLILAAPNNSKVKGKIIGVKRNSQTVVSLEITSSDDVDGLPNFTKSRVGTTIEVKYDKENANHLQKGAILQSYIEYLGDEHGGMFRGTIDTNE
jgi:hypothetical protein